MNRRALVVRLGTVPYLQAWQLQQRLVPAVRERLLPHLLFLLQHPPVYTIGRNGRLSNVLLSEEEIRRLGAELFHVDRGGDVTFHGPGQLVGYPLFNLHAWGYGAVDYVRLLEEALIETLAVVGIPAGRVPGRVGVWVGPAKIAAIGVRVARGTTSHGFALNVTTDLSYFDHIIPCGLSGATVTSIAKELGHPVPIAEIEALTVEAFRHVFSLDLQETALADLSPAVLEFPGSQGIRSIMVPSGPDHGILVR